MSISLSSARRVAVSAVGASAVAGAMLFGATTEANAAPAAPMPAVVGFGQPAPASPAFIPERPGFGGGHGWGHGGFGRGGFGRGWGHGGFGRGWGGRGGFGRGWGHGGWGRGWGHGGWGRGFGGWGHRGFGWGHRGWW
jgi:hypothetical protein